MTEPEQSAYKNWRHWLVGHKASPSSSGSNWRRYHSRLCLFLTIILLTEAAFSLRSGGAGLDVNAFAAVMFSINAVWFFFWVVLLPPFKHGAGVDATRLFADTIISTLYMTAVFSLWYRVLGIEPEHSALDTLYFSAVTFSTLGYGDFKPSPGAQMFAAIQAILGNLHLGMIVGSTFAATQKKSEEEKTYKP